MIARLSGTLLEKAPNSVIIDNGGIGYEVTVPLSTYYALPEKNEKVSLHIYTHVREDALMLFGFHALIEKEIFLLLFSVSGIGPKLATNILSGMGPEELLDAIANGDSRRIQSIPGVGKKIAERISLELKDKASRLKGEQQPQTPSFVPRKEGGVKEDAVSALVNLGYSAKLAKEAVDRATSGAADLTLESLIKSALRVLA